MELPPLVSSDGGRANLVELLLQNLGTVAIGSVFYGFHVILILGVTYSLLPSWRRRWVSLIFSFILFSVCSAMYFLGVRIVIAHIKALQQPDSITLYTFMDEIEWLRCGLFIIAMLIGDGILSWRVTVLYQRKFWIVGVQLAALLIGITLGLASITCMFRASMGHPFAETPHCTTIVFKGQQAAWTISSSLNIFATVQLGRIAWSHHTTLKRSGIRRNSVVNILYILAVSSAIYCALWVPLVSLLFWQHRTGSWLLGQGVLASYLFQNAFQQLVGIYPTLVTFLTLNSESLFGREGPGSATTSSRTRHPTYGSGNWKVAYPASSQGHVQTLDNAVLDVSRSPPGSAKAFLPMTVDDSAATSSPGIDTVKSWSRR